MFAASTNLESVVEDAGFLWSADFHCLDRTVESLHTDPIRASIDNCGPWWDDEWFGWLTVEVFLVICRQVKDYHDAKQDGALYELPPKDLHLGIRPRLITWLQKVY